eukprot:1374803-Rhodomonas_salina.1
MHDTAFPFLSGMSSVGPNACEPLYEQHYAATHPIALKLVLDKLFSLSSASTAVQHRGVGFALVQVAFTSLVRSGLKRPSLLLSPYQISVPCRVLGTGAVVQSIQGIASGSDVSVLSLL